MFDSENFAKMVGLVLAAIITVAVVVGVALGAGSMLLLSGWLGRVG